MKFDNKKILKTALLEAREEIFCEPKYTFTKKDLVRLGEIGQFETGHAGIGNYEYSTAFVVFLPEKTNFIIEDTDKTGTHQLQTTEYYFDELIEEYQKKPDVFADGISRILKILINDKNLKDTLNTILS